MSSSSVCAQIVSVGSCMRDLTSFMERLPKPGETIAGRRFQMGFGGKGANQCMVAAKMGATTALVAKLGDDSHGHSYVETLKEHGISIEHVQLTSASHTGIASIMVDDNGENCIVIMSGANGLLSPDDVTKASETISRASVVVCQWEVPMATNLAAFKLAKKNGVKTIFNAAPASSNVPSDLFPLVDVFCVNEIEAETILGTNVSSVDEAKKGAGLLLKKGCGVAIITMGEKGAIYASAEQPEGVLVPCEVVTAVDTTGAGDAFVGALSYYLALQPDLSMENMVRRSCCVASFSVQRTGTHDSFPFRKDLNSEMFA